MKEAIKEPKENEVEKEKVSKKKKIIIIVTIIFLAIITVIYVILAIIYNKNNGQIDNKEVEYLKSLYGDISINIESVKNDTKTYHICSKKAPFCTNIKYNEKTKNWHYPQGEGFAYAITFLDQAINVLEENNITYYTYVDNNIPNNASNSFILVIKKEDEQALINTIIRINNNDLIKLLCPSNRDSKCTGEFEINIFNSEDYNLIVKKHSKHYGIKNYFELYDILLKNDKVVYGNERGKNIERHNINENMFNCHDEDCTKCKHIAYRYVIGNHNHIGNTIIIEGIN